MPRISSPGGAADFLEFLARAGGCLGGVVLPSSISFDLSLPPLVCRLKSYRGCHYLVEYRPCQCST